MFKYIQISRTQSGRKLHSIWDTCPKEQDTPDSNVLYLKPLQIAVHSSWFAGLCATGAGIILQSKIGARSGAVMLAASLALFAANGGSSLSSLSPRAETVSGVSDTLNP